MNGLLWKAPALAGLVVFAGCNGSGEYLRALFDTDTGGVTRGFAHGEVGADGTPVERTAYGADNPQAGENYPQQIENGWVETGVEQTSTFGVDVDNGSYTLMRDDIRSGRLPHPDGVRPEEYINFFDYGYPEPSDDQPFTIDTELGPSPFGTKTKMLRVGLQGAEIDSEDLRPTNLVFLIDTSGSMKQQDKLPMVKESLYALIDALRPTDTIGIVTYAGNSRVALRSTPVRRANVIRRVIGGLGAGGSTNGEGGIVTAYQMAEEAFVPGGNNRVVLATDGDFNVGRTGDALLALIRDYRERHITITTAGYGRGNFNDELMEGIAREGNGNYFYVDDLPEAKRIFGPDLASTLQIVATDVKIQVEFDPAVVRRYRLVGYENRVMQNREFDDDTRDAGDIGQGHTVTALYELELASGAREPASEDSETPVDEPEDSDVPWEEAEPEPEVAHHTALATEDASPLELPDDSLVATIRLRHKDGFDERSRLQERPVRYEDLRRHLSETSPGYRFALAVAEYAEILRESPHSEGARFDRILELARATQEADPSKAEFVELVRTAKVLHDNR